MRTRVTAHAREAVLEHAAGEELVGHLAHDGAPVAVRGGESLLVRGVKRAEVVAHEPNSAAAKTQAFAVLRDPALSSSDADLAASTRAQVRIRDAMNESVEIINRLEVMRRQMEDTLKVRGSDAALAEQLKALDKKMLDVELMLLSRTDLHSDDKWYVEKYKVYMNLIWLSGEVGTGAGDVAGGAEFRPTDASMATLVELERDLAAVRLAYQKLVETDVKAFNELMGSKMKVIMD